MERGDPTIEADWYKDAVIYQLHVRSYADGNGDGIGDFRGLTERLDHIQDLGATAIWLLPFYPSPLRDGGYDIAEYTDVNREYGTMRDFRRFVREAHRRGLRVITEVVINHTSDQHVWFQRSRHSKPGSKWRDFYVWSDSDTRYGDARIIFQDFESSNWTWDSVAGAYFWHRFYNHQPDLNFDNPDVHDAVLKVVDFWLDLGVDGLRLDAVPYLYEREGTSCENLPETHEFLKKLRAHVDRRFPNRMLLAEANQWPEDTREYFGQGEGDECHMAFNFPVMPRMYMALQMEDRYPLVDIFEQTPDIPETAQWALFLRNHDELTLEMVTDEERDYMYRVYAADPRARINLGIRRRLAPLLKNDRRKIELLNGLLLSLPGTPIVYYGDEIGMGDNIYLGDRDGVRTPMQWTADRNAGFSSANPQQLFLPVNIDPEYRYESVNVEAQESNPNSLLIWMRQIVAMRQRFASVFGSGELRFLRPDNSKVFTYLRSNGETILVVANLSRHTQFVELDLSEYRGYTPIEMFGQNTFPDIGELPYLLTLGPYDFYWFLLQPQEVGVEEEERLPVLTTAANWNSLFDNRRSRTGLETVLPAVLRTRRWFSGKSRSITDVSLVDSISVALGSVREFARILILEVHYTDGEPETYVVPVTYLPEQFAEEFLTDHPGAGLLRLQPRGGQGLDGILCDAMSEELFTARLLDTVVNRRRLKAGSGELRGLGTRALRRRDAGQDELWPTVNRAEQSNTSVAFGEKYMFKLFRRSESGVNPDWEIGRYLTESRTYPHVPEMNGALEYVGSDGIPYTLGVLQEYLPNEGDAWQLALDQLSGYFEDLLGLAAHQRDELIAVGPLAGLRPVTIPDLGYELMGPMLQNASLLGERIAELHLALASNHTDKDFRPESFTRHDYRSMYQSIRNQISISLTALRRQARELEGPAATMARQLLAQQADAYAAINGIKDLRLNQPRMRIHGDLHLGQLLFTGRDFVVIDFEGEPAKPMSVRKFKRSPLRDVAGMMRSWDYAALSAMSTHEDRFNVRRGAGLDLAARGAKFWSGWVGAQFLSSYLAQAQSLLKDDYRSYETLLRAFLIDKAAYELSYELNHRPDWVAIPLQGLLSLLPE